MRTPEEERRYLRKKDMMRRYGCSRGHIGNLIKAGNLPPPMEINGVQVWPVSVIEELDRERDRAYYEQLQAQGFTLPEGALANQSSSDPGAQMMKQLPQRSRDDG